MKAKIQNKGRQLKERGAKRKIVQITSNRGMLRILCDDGTVWWKPKSRPLDWQRLEEILQDER